MSVGVALLDSDHQALIQLINRLHGYLEREGDEAVLDEVFDKLVAYIDYHFAREEKVMEACEYPLVDGHREEHLRFTQELRYVRDVLHVLARQHEQQQADVAQDKEGSAPVHPQWSPQ